MKPATSVKPKRIAFKLLLPLIALLCTAVLLSFQVLSMFQLAEQVDATMELRFRVALSVLDLHEFGENAANDKKRADALERIKQARWYSKALLEGGENDEGHFIPVRGAESIALVGAVNEDLIKLDDLLHHQLAAVNDSDTLSDYKEARRLMDAIIRNIDLVETRMQKMLRDAVEYSFMLTLVLLAVTASLQVWSSRRVYQNVKQLDASRQNLSAANQQLTATEQQLRASNQQLTATEQQLRASNQQLSAHEQQLRAANEELRMSAQRMGLHLDQTSMGVIEWDTKSNATLWNAAAMNIFGYTEKEAIGQSFRDLIVPPEAREQTESVWKKLLNSEEGVQSINTNVKKDGSRIVCEWFNTPLKNGDGQVIGVASMVTDITDKERANEREKELKKQKEVAERFQALAVLSGGVAHDLNNVLGPLVSLPEVLKEDLEEFVPDDLLAKVDAVELLDVMQQSAKRASSVVSDLVDLSRPAAASREDVEWSKMIEEFACMPEVERLFNGLKNVNLNTDLCNSPIWVKVSKSHMLRVVVNVIKNAVEAIHDGGNIVLATRLANITESVSLAGSGKGVPSGFYAVLDIMDSGIGISKQDLARIFDPFFTRSRRGNRKGSGLGLSSVFGIVKDHGGYIDVCSDLGKGTTFSIYLPVNQEEPAEGDVLHEESKSANSSLTGNERILVVDDEPSQCFIAARSLKRYGYDVQTAGSGEEALTLFEDGAAGERSPFDLVVLDVLLGDGMDGLVTYERIRKMFPDQKAIVASGYASDSHHGAAGDLGLVWVSKPYFPEELAVAVRHTLDKV